MTAGLTSHALKQWGLLDSVPASSELSQMETRRDSDEAAGVALSSPLQQPKLVFVEYMRRASTKGSDVRVDSGDLCNPNQWPRRDVDPSVWQRQTNL